MIALNVGSGQRPFDKAHGWVNIDCQERWNPDIVCSGESLPYPDEHVDLIVLHQVREHFGCNEAASLDRECFRVLKPGGSMLVFVPDMYELAMAWLSGKLSDQVYLTAVYGAYMGNEADRHKFGFTAKSLANELRSNCSWSQIKPFDWRTIEGADLARDFWVLAYEAVR